MAWYWAALVLTASCTATVPSKGGTTLADVEAIERSFAGLVAASEAGDADAYAAYLTLWADRKYMDVMRRTADGRWLLARHMYNLNHPEESPPPRH